MAGVFRRAVAGPRPWLAALLALFYPGLGHVYCRAWVRAIAWFALAFAAAAMVMPPTVVESFEAGGVGALLEATRDVPFRTMLPLFFVRGLNVLDAYLVARRRRARAERPREPAAGTCPHCGRELDEELTFCPWCTERLEPGPEPEE